MRKITKGQIAIFTTLFGIVATCAWFTAKLAASHAPADLRGIVLVGGWLLCAEGYAVVAYRTLLRLFPLPEGEIPIGSSTELVYHLHALFFLIFFDPVLLSGALPTPFRQSLHRLLGARVGENSHGSGLVLDPQFVEIGVNCILGLGSTIIPHAMEGSRLSFHRVRIGDGVTIGAGAKVLAGVTIGNGAIVAAQAVVAKHATIPPFEIWGGIPARRIGMVINGGARVFLAA